MDTQIQADRNGVDSAAAGVASAQAQLQLHESAMADTAVRAPFDGVIQTIGSAPSPAGGLSTNLAVGDAVTLGQTLFTIAGPGPMIVRAQVDEQDIGAVRLGQRAVISGADFPGRKLEGTVSRIAPVVVQQTGGVNAAKNVETTISLAQRYPFLRAGMSCDVDIITGNATSALTVPLSAIFDENGKHYVYVVRAGVAHKVSVSKGLASDTDVAITRGLELGDVVVITNLKRLHDGARVSASAASPQPSPTST
jgi:HlyD family secretion protein